MSENKEKKDQFVIAYLNNLDFAETCIEHSVQIAKILNKGLILLHIYDPLLTEVGVDEAESKLKELNSQITETQMHSYISLKGETKEVISKLGQLLNAVVIVSSINTEETKKNKADNPITLLKNMETSRVAYMICNQKRSIVDYSKVLLPLNNARESKEKTLWASYFARFFQSEITLFYRTYKDSLYQKQLNLNLAFARKMLGQFNIIPSNHKSEDRKKLLDLQALDYADKENYGVIICQTTKDKSLFDRIKGLEEEKVLKNLKDKPILFLNPRDDLFVLCE
jgi:hypothetical protein